MTHSGSDTLSLDPSHTALVLIDLQQGIVGMPTAPRSGGEVVANARQLAVRFRALQALVVLVHVGYAENGADRVTVPTDAPPMSAKLSAGWDTIVSELGPEAGDLVIKKHQWGAFFGTELDLQLRRRGITTIVLGGISTNFGVESTARTANEHGYAIVFAEDAMAGPTAEAHAFAVTTIFPRLGQVRSTQTVLDALG